MKNIIELLNKRKLTQVFFREEYSYPSISLVHDRVTQAKLETFNSRLHVNSYSQKVNIVINLPFCSYQCRFCTNERISAFRESSNYILLIKNEFDYYLTQNYIKGLELESIYLCCGTLNYLALSDLYDLIVYIQLKFGNKNKNIIYIFMSDAIQTQETADFLKSIKPSAVIMTIPSFDEHDRQLLNINIPVGKVYSSLEFFKKERMNFVADLLYSSYFPNKATIFSNIEILVRNGTDLIHFQQLDPIIFTTNIDIDTILQTKCLLRDMKKIITEKGFSNIISNYFAKKEEDHGIIKNISLFNNIDNEKLALGSSAYGRICRSIYRNSSYSHYTSNSITMYCSIKILELVDLNFMRVFYDLKNCVIDKQKLQTYLGSNHAYEIVCRYLQRKGIFNANDKGYALCETGSVDALIYYLLPEAERNFLQMKKKVNEYPF